jgi:hypothetical protein
MLGHISCLAPIQHDSEQHALRLAARGTRGKKGGTAGLGRPTQGDAGGPQGTPDQQGQPVCYSNQSSCLLAKVRLGSSRRPCVLRGRREAASGKQTSRHRKRATNMCWLILLRRAASGMSSHCISESEPPLAA